MAGTTANIFVGAPNMSGGGGIKVAPIGTALPTAIITAPDAAFKSLGYITEDGLSIDQASTWETVRDWSGAQVRKFLSDFTGTLTFGMQETMPDVMKFTYGDDNVTVTPATASTGTLTAVKFNATEPDRVALIADILDGPRAMRIVVPQCQVTERQTLTFNRNAPVTHPVTVESYPDSATNSIYWYIDDGVFSA